MSFNPSKCFIMEISHKRNPPHRDYNFCGKVLGQPTSQPYLGVQLDNKLDWGEHISNNISKANRILGLLRRNLWFCPKEVKTTAYTTLVRQILEYAGCAWDPYRKKMVNKLERVQRRAARFCTGDYKRESSVSQMLLELEWDPLESRREKSRLAMMFKIQNDLVGGIQKDQYTKISTTAGSRRNHTQHLEIPFAGKDVYKNSFFPRTSRAWNVLEQEAVSSTLLSGFKRQLNKTQ